MKESGESLDMKQGDGTNRSEVSDEDRKPGMNRNKIRTLIGDANFHIIFKRSSEEEPETATSERIKSQESYTVGDEALLIYTHQTAGGNIDGVETAPKITRWMRGIIQAENKTKVCMSRLDDMVREGTG